MVLKDPVEIGSLLYRKEGFRDGRPCLAGTGTTVHTVAAQYLMGASPEEILELFPKLDMPRIYAALAYFLANRASVVADLDRDASAVPELTDEFNSPRPTSQLALRLYFDEDSMRHDVQRELVRIEWDSITTSQAGNDSLSDADQLRWATDNRRCIFTSNQQDFLKLHRDWAQLDEVHTGIIVLSEQRTERRAIIDALLRISSVFDQESITGHILFLSNWM